MTFTKWNETHFPIPLFRFLADDRRLTPRKSRLYACAIARLIWEQINDPYLKSAVETAERFADGKETQVGLTIANHITRDYCAIEKEDVPASIVFATTESTVNVIGISSLAFPLLSSMYQNDSADPLQQTNRQLADLVREIFPRQNFEFEKHWRSEAVVNLANQIYTSRKYDLMPILADALEETGCIHNEMLMHCRDAGCSHSRGCWVIDLVLGQFE